MSVSGLDVIYITLESVIGIFAVVGNTLVIWAVKLNPALQKTTFFYIISLALTDIAMGMLITPLAVMVSLGVITHFYSCLFMCCLMMIFSHASILSLLAIAVDRYLRVKLPTRWVWAKVPSHHFFPISLLPYIFLLPCLQHPRAPWASLVLSHAKAEVPKV